MLNDEICKLRDELNESILNGEDYEKILEISVRLDELIAEHYRSDCVQNNQINTRAETKISKHSDSQFNNQVEFRLNKEGYAR